MISFLVERMGVLIYLGLVGSGLAIAVALTKLLKGIKLI